MKLTVSKVTHKFFTLTLSIGVLVLTRPSQAVNINIIQKEVLRMASPTGSRTI
jgi:hypothetical protein